MHTRKKKRKGKRGARGARERWTIVVSLLKPVRIRLLYLFCIDFLFFLVVYLCFVGNPW